MSTKEQMLLEEPKGNWFARLVAENWVTPQLDLFVGWELYSKSFPVSGLMHNGVLYHAPVWVEYTSGNECLLLPTPVVQEPGWRNLEPIDKQGNPSTHPNQRWYDKSTGRLLQKGLTQVLNYLPTPTVSDATMGAIFGQNDTLKLTKNGTWRRYIQTGNNLSLGLGRYVQMLPTPKAQVQKQSSEQLNNSIAAQTENRKLSPLFVEKMMGFPEGWTQLKD